MSIKSRWINRGDENEAQHISTEPNGEKGRFWWHEDVKKLLPYPPEERQFPIYGKAPGFITDSMPAQYHEGAQRVIESRSEWKMADTQHNTLTLGSVKELKKDIKRGVERERKEYQEDIRKARREATQAYKENPKEVRQKLDKRAEKQAEGLRKMKLAENQKADLRKHGVDV